MQEVQERSLSAQRQLAIEWDRAKEVWHDRTTEYFDNYFVGPIDNSTASFQQSLITLLNTLQAAQSVAAE